MILANSSAGLYDFRNELVQALLQEHKVVVSLPDEVKTKELEEEGCEVVRTQLSRRGTNPVKDLALLARYRKLLRKYKPDLVLTYTIKPNVYGGMACAAAGIPYIATVTGLGSAFEKGGLLTSVASTLYRQGLRKASCVMFQNVENRELFRRSGMVSGRSRLVTGSGVNLATHSFEPYPQGPVTRFLYVGRMMREKGIGEFLEAAKALHSDQVEFDLIGYCDEDWQDKLDAAEKEGWIRQLGFQTQMHGFYKKASAVVLPTYHEGMSNVLMEASATGRPVIATRISGCREIFDEGITGFGCAPGSAKSLIEALQKFLALDPASRAAMGRSAREKMQREFDRKRVTQDYLEEINAAIRKAPQH